MEQETRPQDFDVLARVRELIESRGWTNYELSQRAGLAPSTLQTMAMRGNQPSLGTVKAICGAMNISLEQFFCDRRGGESDEETALLHNYQMLTTQQQRLVRELAEALAHPSH